MSRPSLCRALVSDQKIEKLLISFNCGVISGTWKSSVGDRGRKGQNYVNHLIGYHLLESIGLMRYLLVYSGPLMMYQSNFCRTEIRFLILCLKFWNYFFPLIFQVIEKFYCVCKPT